MKLDNKKNKKNFKYSSWKLSSKASIAWDLKKVKNQNDAIRNGFWRWQATHFSTKNPINKPAIKNRRLLTAAVFHFTHPVEKDS